MPLRMSAEISGRRLKIVLTISAADPVAMVFPFEIKMAREQSDLTAPML